MLDNFRNDEQHHHDTVKEHEHQEKQETNPNLGRVIDAICKASVKIAEKT
jgi:demethoxyubiquinone hydroxylase (CLK1/Coq7/Cat5 family)